ncbi:hypothetical protein ACH472_32785 [Streptomyces mirabilis]|uniref:hypothetical protein n=1 Tax=Streptomyces mirabilis TaxID=68239 RepID=UPI0037A95FBF
MADLTGLVVTARADGAKVTARRLSDGRSVWSYVPSAAVANARAAVFVQHTGSSERVVLVRAGSQAGSRRTVVDVLPADAHGVAQPVYQRAVPTPGDTGVTFAVTPGGIVIGHGTSGLGSGTFASATEVTSGSVRTVRPRSGQISDCADTCEAQSAPAFTTAAGMVTVYRQVTGCDRFAQGSGTACTFGFSVGSRWQSPTKAPTGYHAAVPLAATDSQLVAAWQPRVSEAEAPTVSASAATLFVVHDLATGRVLAQVKCTSTSSQQLLPGGAQPTTRLSPNGRFLAAGQVVFDLTARTGQCLTGKGAQRGVTVRAVTDGGVVYGLHPGSPSPGSAPDAYGALPGEGASPVLVHAGQDAVRTLPEGAVLPLYVARSGSGVFEDRDIVAVYPAG